jgi:hypothetical protein
VELLSDLHDRQVRGLEAEVASARERLAGPPRRDPPAEPEQQALEREASCLILPGAVDPVDPPPRSLSHDSACPERSSQELLKVVPSEAVPTEVQSTRRSVQMLLSGRTRNISRWAEELEKVGRMQSFMNYWVDSDGQIGQSRRGRLAHKVVKTVYFDALSYFFIIANSIFIGASMEHHLSCAIEGCAGDGTFDVVETAFVAWFLVELLLKVLAEDVRVFLGPDKLWNLLDLVLVASAIGQLAAESGAPSVVLTRNVRLFRVVSILRVVRVVRICQSLRVMIYAILRSLDALFWVLAVLAFFMYIFAMAFMHAATEQFRDNEHTMLSLCPTCSAGLDCAAKCAHLKWLEDHLGSFLKVMLTLFQSMTGGLDWAEVYDQLNLINGVHSFTFVVFIYFIVFLVMNVVTATVVDVTSGVSKRDHDLVVKEEMKRLREYTRDIKEFFKDADTDRSGQLSFEEFTMHLQDPQVKAYFNSLDLDTRQADILFHLLDRDESGEVGISEFLDGCLRLKGEARNLDMNLVIYQLEHILKGSHQLLKKVESRAAAPPESALC